MPKVNGNVHCSDDGHLLVQSGGGGGGGGGGEGGGGGGGGGPVGNLDEVDQIRR